uniref:Beta-lactamase n=1 Tax=Caulobacter sp. (strain K31) TaxID=366602 RepID=B0T7G5_CAUSK
MHEVHIGRRQLLGAGLGLAVGMAAPEVWAQARRPATFDWTLHAPEEVGMTRAGLDGVKAAMQKHIDNGDLTGAVTAIARRNKLVYFEAQGVRDIETGEPIRKDDIFRMMSSTKPTTGVAVMMMLEEGKLSLDDKVSRFIPEFRNPKVAVVAEGADTPRDAGLTGSYVIDQVKLVPATREITIKDLLTHTSGLSSRGNGAYVNQVRHLPDDTLASYAARLGSAALDFQPGSRWEYSAVDGIDMLLRIVEIVSKTPADAFMRERVFEPLGMRDTHYNLPPAKADRLLKFYGKENGQWQRQHPYFGNGPTKWVSGSSGLLSTAHDFLLFHQMLLNQGELNGARLLKPQSIAMMSTNHTGDLFHGVNGKVNGLGFGLTVQITRDPVAADSGRLPGAFGWYGAYGTTTWTDPADEMTVTMLVQQTVPSVTPDFEHAIRRAVVA